VAFSLRTVLHSADKDHPGRRLPTFRSAHAALASPHIMRLLPQPTTRLNLTTIQIGDLEESRDNKPKCCVASFLNGSLLLLHPEVPSATF
jgi:hypothetical protein